MVRQAARIRGPGVERRGNIGRLGLRAFRFAGLREVDRRVAAQFERECGQGRPGAVHVYSALVNGQPGPHDRHGYEWWVGYVYRY